MIRCASLFSQLIGLFDRHEFSRLVLKHHAERYAKVELQFLGSVCGHVILLRPKPSWSGAMQRKFPDRRSIVVRQRVQFPGPAMQEQERRRIRRPCGHHMPTETIAAKRMMLNVRVLFLRF